MKAAAAAGTRQIGIIFNLDKHDEPGSHWVCAFINLDKSAAYYFDSYGYEAPPEVVTLFKRLRDQGIQHTYFNDVRHQRKGSECGMYCLYTIISLLLGKSFYDICVNIVDDDTMNGLRDVLFATEAPRREAIEKAMKLLPAA
jgi:Ulp1 family protease